MLYSCLRLINTIQFHANHPKSLLCVVGTGPTVHRELPKPPSLRNSCSIIQCKALLLLPGRLILTSTAVSDTATPTWLQPEQKENSVPPTGDTVLTIRNSLTFIYKVAECLNSGKAKSRVYFNLDWVYSRTSPASAGCLLHYHKPGSALQRAEMGSNAWGRRDLKFNKAAASWQK